MAGMLDSAVAVSLFEAAGDGSLAAQHAFDDDGGVLSLLSDRVSEATEAAGRTAAGSDLSDLSPNSQALDVAGDEYPEEADLSWQERQELKNRRWSDHFVEDRNTEKVVEAERKKQAKVYKAGIAGIKSLLNLRVDEELAQDAAMRALEEADVARKGEADVMVTKLPTD